MVENAPNRGDLVWLDFSPQKGHEQSGKRPALVVSPSSYNKKTNLALFCPITSKEKGYPFEVSITNDFQIEGVVLVDQIKNLDWKARNVEFIERFPEEKMEQVISKLQTLIRF
ncbi:MAG: endoribonuclease MazF [Candidatus Magasanikbacteria bacterium]